MITWSEQDIEDYICDNFEQLFGFKFLFLGRQIDIDVGIIDVLFFDEETNEIVVVEIKKDDVKESAVTQIMRYIRGIKDYLEDSKSDLKVRGILIGTGIQDTAASALRLIQHGVEFMEMEVKLDITLSPKEFTRNKESKSYDPSFVAEVVEMLKNCEITESGDTYG